MFEQTQVVESARTSARPLAGQVALVTGGSSGIGRGIALSLAAAGADVVVNYVAGATAAESVREELAMHGVRALAIQADVAQESEVDAMFGRIGRELGALDIVVANAGLQRDSAIEHRGELEVYRADLVIVACGAIESAALLLRSTSDAHPHGLANANDQVGRYYMCHHNGALLAITSEPNDSAFQKTLALTDFYRGGPCSDLPLGAVQLMGRTQPHELAPLLAADRIAIPPEQAAARCIDFWLTSEDTPLSDNRVTLDRDGTVRLHTGPRTCQRSTSCAVP